MKIRYQIMLSILLILALILTGCSSPQPQETSKKLTIVTTLFPLYDFSKTLLKDEANVILLLPPGVEPHAYDPTPQDIVTINKADVFIYTGEFMEPWAQDIIDSLKNDHLTIINASENITLLSQEDEGNDAKTHDPHDHEGMDPHIWLDPVNAQQIVKNISKGLIQMAPKSQSIIEQNQTQLISDLEDYNQKCIETFSKTKYHTIIYGGHFAFGYFAKRYGLEQISPYDGFSPDAEPTPSRITELIKTLKESNMNVIFFEELIDPKVARVISEQTGAKMLMLNGAHNVTKENFEKGTTYLEIMESNLKNLKEGLKYNE